MKTNYVISAIVILTLMMSGISLAIIDEQANIIPNGITTNLFRIDILSVLNTKNYKRIISDDISIEKINLLRNSGCNIRHTKKRFASFECPEDIASKYNLREARIFKVVDIDADKQIGADKVWAEGIQGEGASVVILDTGIDSSHTELADSIKGQKDFVNSDNIAEDDNGHGTHVAGIITSNGQAVYNSIGVAPKAGVYALKVCNSAGNCYEDDIKAALEYAVYNLSDAKIVSISIGTALAASSDPCDSDPLAADVNWAVNQGKIVVVAAGNTGRGLSIPGCASGVITVGAVDKNGYVPYWSARGPGLDIVAPGVNIYSTYSCIVKSDCSVLWYQYMSGTSMATPHISGVIALLLQAKPNATREEIKNALYSTATPATGCYYCSAIWLGTCFGTPYLVNCTPQITGAGIVDAYGAYQAIKPSICIPTTEICDSKDNDCDNLTDEDLGTTTCGIGACLRTVANCVNGTPQTCTPGEPTVESCNSVDDDCDGLIDEDLGSTTCGIGACQRTVVNCVDGTLQSCVPGILTTEVCNNGIDDDCDGNSDCEDTDCITDPFCETNSTYCVGKPDGTLCSDGLYCTVNDACSAGVCVGVGRACPDNIQCTTDICDEANDKCINPPDSSLCTDNLYCNGIESCDAQSGCQPGTPVVCNDNNACTTDGCSETIQSCSYAPITSCINNDGCCPTGCSYSNDSDCIPTGIKCWNAEYNYTTNKNVKKFCKCAEGSYGYKSYTYTVKKVNAYQYIDTNDNENWAVKQFNTRFPVYQVKCMDSNFYPTNRDYYR